MHKIVAVGLEQDVLDANRRLAEDNYKLLSGRGIKSFDFMGAIGSGKTLIIEKLVEQLMARGCKPGAITGDVAGDDDARRLEKYGIPVKNINTGKDCHLEAHFIDHAIEHLLEDEDIDTLFIENVGNLVCPADFPLGTDMRIVVVSVTEGDDMVRKHPVIFGTADIAVVNKVDLAPYVEVDVDRIIEDYMELKPSGTIITTNARSGEGLDKLASAMGLW